MAPRACAHLLALAESVIDPQMPQHLTNLATALALALHRGASGGRRRRQCAA